MKMNCESDLLLVYLFLKQAHTINMFLIDGYTRGRYLLTSETILNNDVDTINIQIYYEQQAMSCTVNSGITRNVMLIASLVKRGSLDRVTQKNEALKLINASIMY